MNEYKVTSLDKALIVLDLIIDRGRDLSITEISQTLGLGKGTVHRILNTLKSRKFIQQDEDTKLYGLGVRTLAIGAAAKKEKFLRKVMAPFMRVLHEECKETVNAAVWEYNEIRYIYRIESEEMLRIATPASSRFPVHCTATGKIFLSYISNEDIKRICGRKPGLKKMTENTITDVEQLIQEIERIRSGRVAIDDEEALYGVICVAAPIVSSLNECVAAISISAPKNRVTEEIRAAFMKLIAKEAEQISKSLNE